MKFIKGIFAGFNEYFKSLRSEGYKQYITEIIDEVRNKYIKDLNKGDKSYIELTRKLPKEFTEEIVEDILNEILKKCLEDKYDKTIHEIDL